MWIGLLVLFVALSPGVLFTIPSLGKKMGGKVMIATMHAVLFVIVANLFTLVEGFQMAGSIPMSQTITQRVLSAIGAGSRSLAGNTTYLGQIMEGRGQIMEGRGQIMEGRGQIMEGRGQITEGRGQIMEGRWPAPPAGQQGGLEATEVDRKAGEAKAAQVAAEKARAQAAAAQAVAEKARAQAAAEQARAQAAAAEAAVARAQAQAQAQARNASLQRRAARR